MKIKAKIIGQQVWTVENLTREQYKKMTGINIPIINDIWDNDEPKCCTYESIIETSKKKNYLFDKNATSYFSRHRNTNNWRIPTIKDLDTLFNFIHPNASIEWPTDNIAIALRGTYGWLNNGTNKIGYNAVPNPTKNESGELTESEIARWWVYNETSRIYNGFGLYNGIDVVALCGTHDKMGLAVRLVMDLQSPRIEDDIEYV
jgi:uncharacterized protein (TIGR02145 family)